MSICKKRRRKIILDHREYFWYVSEDPDSSYQILTIISDDKEIILSIPLNTQIHFAISKGRIFQNKKTNGKWQRYILSIQIPDKITPNFIMLVIKWAVEDGEAEMIHWNGSSIPV